MLSSRFVESYLGGRTWLYDDETVRGIRLHAFTVMGSATLLSCRTLTWLKPDATHCPAATWSKATKLCSSTNVGATSAEEGPAAMVKVHPFDCFLSGIDAKES